MRRMSNDTFRAFLQQPHLARLATVRSDGRPHLVPIWYEWDGAQLRFEAQAGSVKVANLARDPRAAVLVDMTHGGMQYLAVAFEGTARIVDDPSQVLPSAERIFSRYLGEEGLSMATPQRLLYEQHPVIVEVTPTRIVTWDNTATGRGVPPPGR